MKNRLNELDVFIAEFEELTGIKCDVEITLNGRLRKSLGRCIAERESRYSFKPVSIQLSKKFYEVATLEEKKKVLAHEYAHYCTFITYGIHSHETQEFKDYCKLLRTTSSPSIRIKTKMESKYEILCSCCEEVVAKRATANADVVKYHNYYKSTCCNSSLIVKQNY